MNGYSDLLSRLVSFDKTAFADLKAIGESDPIGVCEVLWSFLATVAEVSSHVPSGLVDTALLMMFDLKGQSDSEEFIAAAWGDLGEESRGELLYSGIANPAVFSNEFCLKLYQQSNRVADRRTIACSLYSTALDRNLPTGTLVDIIRHIGSYGDSDRDYELSRLTARMLDNLPHAR